MKLVYDKKADALAIVFREGRVSQDKEIGPEVFAGYDREGNLVEIQMLDVSERERPWITLEAAAVYLKRSTRTLERWIKDGKMKAKKIGRQYQIDLKEIERLNKAS